MSEKSALDQLREAVRQQKTASMPEESADPRLQDVHKTLKGYDAYVSQAVIDVLQGGMAPTDNLSESQLDQQLTELETNASEESVRRELRKYRNYKTRLDRMFELAQTVSTERARNQT